MIGEFFMEDNERFSLYDFNLKMSPALAHMLLTVINDYDWLEYEKRTGEFDEALLWELGNKLVKIDKH